MVPYVIFYWLIIKINDVELEANAFPVVCKIWDDLSPGLLDDNFLDLVVCEVNNHLI